MSSIRSISNHAEAMAEAARRWRAGNNAGDGGVWGLDVESREAEAILSARADDEVDVYAVGGVEWAVSADGWAVEITPAEEAKS